MSEPKKVSLQTRVAGDTTRHNDRELYHGDHSMNIHWDRYGCGSSTLAERKVYDELFSETLLAQNERAKKMRKFERVMTMVEYREKHMPRETIIQLGCEGNNDDVEDWVIEEAEKQREFLEEHGAIVISWDIHFDETTPHIHMRWLMCSKNRDGHDVVDVTNCLRAHGIDSPEPSKKDSKTNNPLVSFTRKWRQRLEDSADRYEVSRGREPVNRERTRRKNVSVRSYKLRKEIEELQEENAQLSEEIKKLLRNHRLIEKEGFRTKDGERHKSLKALRQEYKEQSAVVEFLESRASKACQERDQAERERDQIRRETADNDPEYREFLAWKAKRDRQAQEKNTRPTYTRKPQVKPKKYAQYKRETVEEGRPLSTSPHGDDYQYE